MAKQLGVLTGGGDCPGLNAAIRAVVRGALARGYEVVGIRHGWRGLVEGDFVPLTRSDIAGILPRGGTILGTTGFDPLREEEHVAQLLRNAAALDALVAIGGDGTLGRAARLHGEHGLPVVCVPKTIDNDVGDSEFKLIDHTPGYASTARYWAHMVQFANEENAGSSPADPVLVMQAMGRRIGFIPAAARLADPDRQLPLQIYLAERELSIEQLSDNVNDLLKREGRAIVVVSEGLKLGDIGELKDSFGHTQFSASELTVGQLVINALNSRGLPVKGSARANIPGTDQRHNMIYASTVDLDEAYRAGQKAAELAAAGESGFMSTILREPGEIYNVRFDKVPLAEVANSERTFPAAWISKDGTDVTDEFVRYARPLIGNDWPSVPLINGRIRMARMEPKFADQKLAKYIPQADRS